MRQTPSVRRATVIALSLSLVSMTSCGLNSSPSDAKPAAAESSSPAPAKDEALAAMVPEEIKKAGVIRMAINPAYPPFVSTGADGKTLEGFEPDLANSVAAMLGVKIEFVPTSFDAIIPALQAKSVDIAMSSIGDTKAREQIVDFATY